MSYGSLKNVVDKLLTLGNACCVKVIVIENGHDSACSNLDGAVRISHSANILGKCIYSTILSLAIDKL